MAPRQARARWSAGAREALAYLTRASPWAHLRLPEQTLGVRSRVEPLGPGAWVSEVSR